MKFVKEDGIDYPVGVLDDVRVYFQHYFSDEDALKAWNRRKKRIIWEHLIILFTDRDNCSEGNLFEFDKLPFEKKVVFTHKSYPNIKCSYFIECFKNDSEVGVLSDYKPNKIGIRYFDEYNFHQLIDG